MNEGIWAIIGVVAAAAGYLLKIVWDWWTGKKKAEEDARKEIERVDQQLKEMPKKEIEETSKISDDIDANKKAEEALLKSLNLRK